jgi:thiamine biosynthesis protein ThiI
VKHELIIVRYSEIALKAKSTRIYFEKTLIKNIINALDKKQISNSIRREYGRIYVYTNQINESIDALKKIFGIVSISPAIQTKSKIKSMSQLSINILKEKLVSGKTFALRVTRTGKHNFTSQDVAIKIGAEIVKTTNASVELTKPDFELFIEIRNGNAYLFTEKIRGVGGLPLGTQGKVLALIDSPKSILAAWYLMHRGCRVVFVNTDESNIEVLHSFITKWYANTNIFNINPGEKNFYRNLKNRAAELNCDALITDYTMHHNYQNMLSSVKLLKKHIELPILCPLIAMEEDEIKQKCKDIGIQL